MAVKLRPQTQSEMTEYRYTHRIDIDHNDLTQATVNTDQVFTFYVPGEGDQIKNVGMILSVSFENTADSAFNSTTVRVGKTGTDNAYVTATQINKNGTTVFHAFNTGSGLPDAFAAANTNAVLVSFSSMAAKALANLNKGHCFILLDIFRADKASQLPVVGGELVGQTIL